MLNKFKKRLLLLALTAAVGCSTFGLTMAYMTDSEQNTNVFTVGDVTVDLIETKWEPANGINTLPRKTVQKNPAVTNKGSLDCWIFLKVKSPKKLFSFETNDFWQLINKTTTDTEVEYVYGYKDILEPNGTTESLFDTVTMVNYLEGSINPNEKLDIPIEAMAVQWNVDKSDAGLDEIYEHYLDQKAYNDEEGIW